MENDAKNMMIEKLTDEELGQVVGGRVDWNRILKYLTESAPNDPIMDSLIYMIKQKNWTMVVRKMMLICKNKADKYPELVALYMGYMGKS